MADERPDINLINCDNSDYGLADDKVRGRVTTIENLLNNKNISNINEMAFEEKKDQTSKDDLNNAVTTLNNTIVEMQENFMDSVDQIAEACRGAGSAPEGEPPYSPEAVAEAIAKIPQGGGGGTPYSMLPQEVLGFIYGGDACSYNNQIEDNDDVIIAHVVPTTNDSSIAMNFKIQLQSYYAGTVTFSLVVDDVVVAQNIVSVTFLEEEYNQKIVSFNYTFDPSLTNEYHVIALRANMSSGLYSVYTLCPLCSLYGSNFEEVQNVGCYLVNNIFSSYYTPSGFTTPNNPPTNPIVYQLDNEGSMDSCWYGEEVDTVMSSSYYDQFDSGVSFYMNGVTNYQDPETYEPITPNIADTLIFSNGKFIYNHSEAKTYNVMEYHYFILPVIGKFFNMFRKLCIHGKMVSKSGSINYDSKIYPLILERVSQNRVEKRESDDYIYCSDLQEDDEFTAHINIPTPENDNIQFIGFYFFNMGSDSDAFTIEIDKIQGEPSEY